MTPLTLAVEQNNINLVNLLLKSKANPLIENIHGNTAIKLACKQRFCKFLLTRELKLYTCNILHCKENYIICYNNRKYIITNILPGGSCSLAVLEIKDLTTQQQYIAKIKSNVGGLEIRNYISLDKYIDIFTIKNLIIYNKSGAIIKKYVNKNIHCLIQKIIMGENLSKAMVSCNEDQQKIIVFSAIKALCALHKKGYVHNDALPDNCKFNSIISQAEFIDYDMMRIVQDFASQEEWQQSKYLDFKRLLNGDRAFNNNILGLKDYFDNITNVIQEFPDSDIDSSIKNRLLIHL